MAEISRLLGNLRGVSVMEKFHHASFLVGKKVFAYTRPDAVVMKSRERIEKLLQTRGDACPLVMGKRVMKEWMVTKHDDLNQYREDVKLFKRSCGICFGGAQAETLKRSTAGFVTQRLPLTNC